MTLEEIVNSLKSAGQDYGQMFNNNPKMDTFASILQKGIGQLIPSNADFKSPEAMRNWGTAAALNAPMGLTFIGKNAANWNPVKAAEAEKLLNAGVDPAQVWKEHLIGRMPDKSLFSEIDDSALKVRTKDFSNPYGSWGIDSNKNADFNEVQSLLDDGFSEQKIHKMTGWAKQVGGDWMPPLDKPLEQKIIEHEPLSKLYDFNNLQTKGWNTDATNAHGSYDNTQNKINIHALTNDNFNLQNKEGAKSVAAHELQHAIQNKENWAMGGSPNTTLSDPLLKETIRLNLSDKLKSMDETVSNSALSDFGMNVSEMSPLQREIARTSLLKETRDGNTFQIPKNLTPYQLYRRLTGEAQARATQDRMNMNMQQRRNTYPLAGGKLSDITLDQLINRYR